MLVAYALSFMALVLTGGSVAALVSEGDDGPVRIRTLARSGTGAPFQWEAVQLCNTAALFAVGQLLDVDLRDWCTSSSTGLYLPFTVTDLSDGLGRAIVVLGRKSGDRWVVDRAFGRSSSVAPSDLVAMAQATLDQFAAATASAPYVPPSVDTLTIERAPVPSPRALPAPVDVPSSAPAPDFEEVAPVDPDADAAPVVAPGTLDDEEPETWSPDEEEPDALSIPGLEP